GIRNPSTDQALRSDRTLASRPAHMPTYRRPVHPAHRPAALPVACRTAAPSMDDQGPDSPTRLECRFVSEEVPRLAYPAYSAFSGSTEAVGAEASFGGASSLISYDGSRTQRLKSFAITAVVRSRIEQVPLNPPQKPPTDQRLI